mmetsp:Transcript_16295/g.19313  ORF Transcript_16295/g.19313 Transcript_16295/m.19313 type:complete len:260 (+) Transcript_16295:511-1290(+)
MGDVGKFVMTLARLEPSLSCNIIPIALSVENSSEGTDKGLEVDVEDPTLKTNTEDVLVTMSDTINKIDVANDSAEKEIGDAIEGADAVISCLGNRQPSMERWCALGTRKVVSGMHTKNIRRLVCLSSMGIGKDFMKTTPLTVLWAVMLKTCLRSARKDLYGLEKVVRESDNLDFVLVRPVGLTPQQPPQGSCDHLVSKPAKGTNSGLQFMLAKSDAAAFMLGEALAPTIHSREVTIGYFTTFLPKPVPASGTSRPMGGP